MTNDFSGARTSVSAATCERQRGTDLLSAAPRRDSCAQERPTPLGFGRFHPGGVGENSPAFSGVRPSSGAASSASAGLLNYGGASGVSDVAAPEAGRTPLNRCETLGYSPLSLRDRCAAQSSAIRISSFFRDSSFVVRHSFSR